MRYIPRDIGRCCLWLLQAKRGCRSAWMCPLISVDPVRRSIWFASARSMVELKASPQPYELHQTHNLIKLAFVHGTNQLSLRTHQTATLDHDCSVILDGGRNAKNMLFGAQPIIHRTSQTRKHANTSRTNELVVVSCHLAVETSIASKR